MAKLLTIPLNVSLEALITANIVQIMYKHSVCSYICLVKLSGEEQLPRCFESHALTSVEHSVNCKLKTNTHVACANIVLFSFVKC